MSGIYLTKTERLHKFLLETPEGSLTRWGVDKIEYSYEHQITKINLAEAMFVRKVIVVAMPIFAFIDIFWCAGKACFHAVVLNPKMTLNDCLACLKSIPLFFTAIPLVIIAFNSPRNYYRSQSSWDEIMRSNISRKAKGEVTSTPSTVVDESHKSIDKKANLINFFKTITEEFVHDDMAKKFLLGICQSIDKEVSSEGTGAEIVMDAYISFYAQLLVTTLSKNVKFESERDRYLMDAIVKFRDPSLRNRLLIDTINSIINNGKEVECLNPKASDRALILMYLIRKITENTDVHFQFSAMINKKSLKSSTSQTIDLITNLHSLLDSDLLKEQRERMVLLLIDCFENGGKKNFKQGMKIFSILTLLNSSTIAKEIIDSTGVGKEFKAISDPKILESLFKKTFGIEDINKDASDRLWKLRAPWALVKFHLRLKETKDPKLCQELLKTNQDVVISALNGTYQDLRMSEEDNPHLAKIFKGRSDLKDQWQKLPIERVSELYPEASMQFKDYNIHVVTDPSDNLLIGNDMQTCVNLDGRLERLGGLIGFIRDGKTQTIVAKDKEDPTIYAETQLQLLWDEKNCKPVLYFEEVNY